jgi:hypothetical protein
MKRYDPLEAPDPENGSRWMSRNVLILRGAITAMRVFACRT